MGYGNSFDEGVGGAIRHLHFLKGIPFLRMMKTPDTPNAKTMNHSFLVEKSKLHQTKFEVTATPEIQEGEALLKIEKYTFSSNNITYALMGERARYWAFFPAEDSFGRIPVWGFAQVVTSRVEGLAVGERFFGYLPMSDFLKVEVGKMSPFGFSDQSAHRSALSPIYNYYTKSPVDPAIGTVAEDYALVIRPLFSTSFLIYHFLKDENFFAAEQIVLSSASSKTALGLAFMLSKNRERDGKKIIGLTSPGNVAFVKATGYYDSVIAYPDLEHDLPKTATTIVDFAGNAKYLHRLDQLLGNQMHYTARVGLTDWKAEKNFSNGPKTKLFFAPDHGQKRYKEWGAKKTTQLINSRLVSFTQSIASWMSLEYLTDQSQVTAFYLQLLNGVLDPAKGYVVSLAPNL